MKNLTRYSLVLLSLAILVLTAGCSGSSPTAPTRAIEVDVKFITPPLKEISGPNTLEVSITNVTTDKVYSLVLNNPEAILFPNKTFFILSGKIELPVGDFGEKITYRLKATYLGLGDDPKSPSPEVSHLVTINGMSPYYGDSYGMYFAVTCGGEIEMAPEVDLGPQPLWGTKPFLSISPAFFNAFAGNQINVTAEKLESSASGESVWRPIFLVYDLVPQGTLRTSRFSRLVMYGTNWNTSTELPPSTTETFVRVRATVEYQGGSQVVTDQVLVSGGLEWPSQANDGYRIFRVGGGYGGKG